jgi:hypothetical protein
MVLGIDTLVFKILVEKMAGDLDVDLPDYPESFKHCAIANVGGLAIRMAGYRIPVHYIYFYHIFYNKYGLNQIAVFLCLLVMAAIEFGMLIGLAMMLAR